MRGARRVTATDLPLHRLTDKRAEQPVHPPAGLKVVEPANDDGELAVEGLGQVLRVGRMCDESGLREVVN